MKNRGKQTGKWILGLAIIAILLGCDLSAPISNPAPPAISAPNEWVQVENYTIILHDVAQEVVVESNGTEERVVYLQVEYDNQGNEAVDYRLNQWSIFDDENYAYDYEIYDLYYEDQGKPRLRESMLNPGMQVKGWVAFPIPNDVTINRAQFLTGYLDGTAVDFAIDALEPSP